jgi:hypothetical protein
VIAAWWALGLAVVSAWAAEGGAPPAGQASETPAEPAPPADEEDEPETVIVFSEYLARQARQELIAEAVSMGYTRVRDRDGRTILRHDAPYMGELVLHDDGRVEFKRQPLRFEPFGDPKKATSWLTCVIVPLCIRPGGAIVSQRRFKGYERQAWTGISDEVTTWNDRIADAATAQKANELPLQLERLWAEGVPLDGGPALTRMEDRRAALLDYWDTRTDTDWGEQVRRVVESFVRGEVQGSEHPYTAAEMEAFDLRRRSPYPFPFRRPTPPAEELSP